MIDEAGEGRKAWYRLERVNQEAVYNSRLAGTIAAEAALAMVEARFDLRHLQRCHSQGLRRMREAAAREMAPHMSRRDRLRYAQIYANQYVNWAMRNMVDNMAFAKPPAVSEH